MSLKLVSVIVVNWNGRSMLQECMDALLAQTYPAVEIVVVDNGSKDDSVFFLKSHYPAVKSVALSENKGFAGGNVEGLKSATGELVALLNNDACPDSKWLAALVQGMAEDDRIGLCASRMVFYDRPDIIDSGGDGCLTSGHGIKMGNREPALGFMEKKFVFGACAGAALYRRKMIDEIGFFDEDFYLNCEDTDLNFRAQLMGWKCLYVSQAWVRHRVNATLSKTFDRGIYFLARNDEYVGLKNMPFPLMVRYLHHKVVQEIGGLFYFCVIRGQWRAYLKGKLDFLRNFPLILAKRKGIQQKRVVSIRYLRSILTPVLDRRLLANRFKRILNPSR